MSTLQTVKGVRVNCIGDREKCHRPQYEPIEIPITDPIFSERERTTSDITDRIGIPLFTWKCPPSPVWANSKEASSDGTGFASSSEAAALHLSCNTNEQPDMMNKFGFGFTPGSFLAVRQDRKPLKPLHMEALCRYCRDYVLPLFSHHLGEYAPDEPLSQEAVLGMICRPTFSIFFYERFEEDVRARGGGYVALSPLYGA
ncbi:uncharacterized protein DFL_001556 [Arthrobotrys flagrans]|uniref:Uncharacterized protein n=1 Tax=Arthrobotrys flagrans TaxID=97331 RepID=A0A437A7Y4_ARTFL|nr:hypothetical protein DFL_001556 [Arthrobotrys flagrans]